MQITVHIMSKGICVHCYVKSRECLFFVAPPYSVTTIDVVTTAYEDGNVRDCVAEFEDSAVRVKAERTKSIVLRCSVRSRANVVLDAARAADIKLKWSTAEEALLAGFSGLPHHKAVIQRLKDAIL